MVMPRVGLRSPGNREPGHLESQPCARASILSSGRQVAAPTRVGVEPPRRALAEQLLTFSGWRSHLPPGRGPQIPRWATAAEAQTPGQRRRRPTAWPRALIKELVKELCCSPASFSLELRAPRTPGSAERRCVSPSRPQRGLCAWDTGLPPSSYALGPYAPFSRLGLYHPGAEP